MQDKPKMIGIQCIQTVWNFYNNLPWNLLEYLTILDAGGLKLDMFLVAMDTFLVAMDTISTTAIQCWQVKFR